MLEELKLESRLGVFPDPLDLFCGQAGRLRDVTLEHIPVRWDSGALAGLRSFKMKGEGISNYSPTARQVRGLLEANPGLEEMYMEDLTIAESFGDDAGEWIGRRGASRVVLSKLQELRLVKLPFELVQAVVSNIEIPSIRHLELECLLRGQPAYRLLAPGINHLVPTLLRQSKGTREAEIAFGGSSLTFATYLSGQESPTIRIRLEDTVPTSGFDWLAENFFHPEGLSSVSAAEAFQVCLKFGQRFDMTGGTFIPILDRLSAVKVKSLTIENACQNGEALINYLGRLKVDSQWPLPHLTSLTVGGPSEMATLLLLSLHRRNHHSPTNGSPTAPRPATLECLDIKSLLGVGSKMAKALTEYISWDRTLMRGRPWVPTDQR